MKRGDGIRRAQENHIAQLIDNTFGPNPCKQRTLYGPDLATAELTCDLKRCIYCGPRKKMLIQLQMQAGFGDLAYVGRTMSRAEIDTALERDKKARQRGIEGELLYQVVGDPATGYIIVSNRPLIDTQRFMALKEWLGRILDLYHHAGARIRRSRALGRLSLVRPRRGRNAGQPSEWVYLIAGAVAQWEAAKIDMHNLREEYREVIAEVWGKRAAAKLPLPDNIT